MRNKKQEEKKEERKYEPPKPSKKTKITGTNFKNVRTEKFEEIKLDPLQRNEGDDDLAPYLQRYLTAAGGPIPEMDKKSLNRALHSGTLLVTGVKLWSALHSETWRHREAAVTAFLEYLEDPMLEKYIGKTRMLFLAAMDVSKAACLDKLLQIYMIGLDILHKAMNSEICGEDVQPKDVNNSLRPLIPHIIEKICELNYRARDKSLVILIDVFRHPKADVRVLIENIMDITEKGPQPDKAPWNVLMARLEILYRVITEFGIDDKAWNWEAVFTSLVCQSFFNQNHEVQDEPTPSKTDFLLGPGVACNVHRSCCDSSANHHR